MINNPVNPTSVLYSNPSFWTGAISLKIFWDCSVLDSKLNGWIVLSTTVTGDSIDIKLEFSKSVLLLESFTTKEFTLFIKYNPALVAVWFSSITPRSSENKDDLITSLVDKILFAS